MAQIPGSGFETTSLRKIGRFLSALGWTSAVAVSLVHGQAASAPRRNSANKDNPPVSAVNPETQGPTPPAAIAPVQAEVPPVAPPQPPAVTWDSNLLTVDAENSTLGDILAAVRTRTGASIEIPLAASRERVFVHLGPGPVREIISSLLYGTGFDYIIEAAEDDPDTLRSVVVTAQGKGDDSTVSSPAVAVASKDIRGSDSQGVTRREGGMRMMRGWAAPGKTTFQAEAEAAIAAEEANRESGSASDNAGPESQNPSAAGAQDSTSDAASASSASSSRGNANSVTESDIPPETASSSTSGAERDDQSGISQSIQNMTRMFELRRQIQAKQNQAEQQKQSPPN